MSPQPSSSSCWWKSKHRRRFVPGRCHALAHERPAIGRMLSATRVATVNNSDDDRELLARAVFVEESLRYDDDAEEDENRHRCSDPRDHCHTSCVPPRRRRRGGVLPCISMYFAYFHDIKTVYRIKPSLCRGNGDDVPFAASIDPQTGDMYVYCDESTLDKCLIVSEGIPDHRVAVNDTFVPYDDNDDSLQKCHGSPMDRRVFSVLACIMNVERLVYDTLKNVSAEKTLAELTLVADNDSVSDRRCRGGGSSSSYRRYEEEETMITTTTRTMRQQRQRRDDCFL